MLSKEECLARIKELVEARRMHGQRLFRSQQLFSAYNRRYKELTNSYLLLPGEDVEWLEKETVGYCHHLLIEFKAERAKKFKESV